MQGPHAARERPHNYCKRPFTRPSADANGSRAHGRYGGSMRGHRSRRSEKRPTREEETWNAVVRHKGPRSMTCSLATGFEGYAAVRIGDVMCSGIEVQMQISYSNKLAYKLPHLICICPAITSHLREDLHHRLQSRALSSTPTTTMPGSTDKENDGHAHIEIPNDDEKPSPRPDGESSPGLRNSKGWDGKLRMPKSASMANPEALTDSDYSDDENVMKGEKIDPDEDLLDDEDPETDEIICSHSRISSISSLRLERFQKVARICLRQNSIEQIDGLSALAETLQDLDLYDNLISHIRGLDDLKNLTSLDLSFNKIKHIKHINHLTKLKELYLVANKISKIEGLEGLDNVTSLELGSNRIREIKNLDSLKAIEELWLAKNKITELTGLGGMPNLRLLSIQSNRITDLSPLKDVPTLEELYISHNILESLEGLEHNPKLHVLDISNNKITSIKGLELLAELEELWASYNLISDYKEVAKYLADKKNLTTVYFEGNPLQLQEPVAYRNRIRLTLPQVKQIDATFVRT
ncbi:adenylate cyclase [Fusarium austroafricanum]|uniref:Adenylate cyclase n=1 Tax=Fusarium austroafricanum TaxID=2364996 RepID=A0A8H4KJD1_9HYPO|nr:adenylate cyclase [Fusarium austroafricanum]